MKKRFIFKWKTEDGLIKIITEAGRITFSAKISRHNYPKKYIAFLF